MSHSAERKEKVCLNCNARVFGPYCQVCGQHNVEPKETAWGLVVHFFNDITHFEGKFITSLRYLFFKPGLLTAEYIRGRRNSYMNPVRMYVFASAFFFILFFTFFSKSNLEMIKVNQSKDSVALNDPGLAIANIAKAEALENAGTKEDSAAVETLFASDSLQTLRKLDSVLNLRPRGMLLTFTRRNYKSIAAYDSAQRFMPADKRDHWLKQMLVKRLMIIDEKYDGDLKKFNAALLEYSIHALPKVLFVSLPLFAFLLYLLYIRRKKFYYVSHVIFVIHFYVFLFLGLLLYFSNGKLQEKTGWDLTLVSAALWVYMVIYLYKSMRRVYEQGRAKTLLKYFILLFILLLLFSFLFVGLFSYSFFNI